MMLGPRLQLKQSQQLVMTPQLQQAIKLLQMSSLDVADFMASEVERNPLLSIDDGGADAPAAGGDRAGENHLADKHLADNHLAGAADRVPDGTADRVDAKISAADPGGTETGFDTGQENMAADGDRMGAMGEPSTAPQAAGAGAGVSGGGEGAPLEEILQAASTLRDHLLGQIRTAGGGAAETALAGLLVDELDEAGYLRADLDDLAARLGARDDLVARAVDLLQTCDPVGVGARDLAECLALQLKAKDRFDPAMAALVASLDDLAAARFDRLRSRCGVDAEDLAEMIAEIRALNPRPASGFTVTVAQTVIPDVFVAPTRFGGWTVEVNGDALPKVLLDTKYAETLSASGRAEAQSFVAECRQNADWLLRALDQRAKTILKVSSEIVRRQSAFFAEGVAALAPMTLRDVAEAIDMHESTVSRVTSNKHLSCERGVYELKFFFTQAIPGCDGADAVSAESVRYQVKALIEKENPCKPLSDDKIAECLRDAGVDIARRTVAKYRESMEIPSSARRKRLKAAMPVR